MGNPLQDDGGSFLPPSDMAPSEVVALLIANGSPPSVVVDFPRMNQRTGKPIAKVRVRRLPDMDLLFALANGRSQLAKLIKKGEELEWRPTEMEAHLRSVEILAVACRRVTYRCETHQGVKAFYPHACPQCTVVMPEFVNDENPDPPFFERGAIEARKWFDSSELGALMNVYSSLRADWEPNLSEMDLPTMEAWIQVLAAGIKDRPFSFISREDLEALTLFCVESVVELGRLRAGLTATSSSGADSSEPSKTTSETPPSVSG